MTINKKGGKHKHRKRQRNNPSEDRENPKHIERAFYENGEYYAIVQRALGNKRFEVKIIDTKWTDKNLVFNAPLRGSKKMRRYGRIQLEDLVKIEYDSSIKMIRIVQPYKEWEKDYIFNTTEDDDTCRIVKNNIDVFDFSNVDEKYSKKDNDNLLPISEITGIPSSDDEEEITSKIAVEKKKLDELIDNI